MPVHQGPGDIRVVARHLFPHVYHEVDKMKLLSASWRALRALAMGPLPSNYPYQMYTAVAGGQQRRQAGVRPPTYYSMRVAYQTAAPVLRTVTGWHTLPSAQFFQPLTTGWVGFDQAVVVVICQFLQGYHKQLWHANVMVCRSTQHKLYEAMQRFHPDMPCVRRGLSRHYRAHGMDHDRFVFYMHVLGFRIAFPPVPRNTGSVTPCAERYMRGRRPPSTNGWMLVVSVCGMRMRLAGPWLHGSGIRRVFLRGRGCPSRCCPFSRPSIRFLVMSL